MDPTFNFSKVVHATVHHIITTGPSVFSCPRRLTADRLRKVKAEFDHMLQFVLIRPPKSPLASPFHLVKKSEAGRRLIGDYRRLNSITVPDRYSIPNIQDFATNLNDCTIFSKIDLIWAYHQIPVNLADIPKIAITTLFGNFEFFFMPFGLRNATSSFQRFIDEDVQGMNFVFAYVDDLLVASDTKKKQKKHVKYLSQLFERLSEYHVCINGDKCVFNQNSLEFLGHLIDSNGIQPLSTKVEAIQKILPPTSLRQLRQFLGLVNFYRSFIPKCADKLLPLTVFLKAQKKKNAQIILTDEALSSFELVKKELSSISSLAHPVPDAPLSLTVDASDSDIGLVLHQVVKGITQPLAFFSCQLKSAERRCSTFGRHFVIYTDHKPLTFALSSKTDKHSPRTFRHLDYISQFTSDIRHIPGTENVPADALSRLPVSAILTPSSIDLTVVTQDQPALDSLDLTSDKYSCCKFSQVPLLV